MDSSSIVSLLILASYAVLVFLCFRQGRPQVQRPLLTYLAAGITWGLISFLGRVETLSGLSPLWDRLLPVTGLWMAISFFHLVSGLDRSHRGLLIAPGYIVTAVIAVLATVDYALRETGFIGVDETALYSGEFLYLIAGGGSFFAAFSVFHLVKRRRASRDIFVRNEGSYLFLALGIACISSLAFLLPASFEFPLEQVGFLASSILLLFAGILPRLPDIGVMIRKGLAYSLTLALILGLSVTLISGLQAMFGTLLHYISVAAIILAIFPMSSLLSVLPARFQGPLDRVRFRQRYSSRQKLANLPHTMRSVLDLKELAESMLNPVPRGLNAAQASLLLPCNGEFAAYASKRFFSDRSTATYCFGLESPVVRWLSKHDKPVSRWFIDQANWIGDLSAPEKNALEAGKLDLLVPINNKGRLVGVLALSRKLDGGLYSIEDLDLLMGLARQMAGPLENAQVHARVMERAHTDELTGLLNHSYFHDRVDEEIARCSRFGSIFSLAFIDLDHFKKYNDIYGHPAGDDLLRQIGHTITNSIRSTDRAFRYGGDEFTIILPEAHIDDAYAVAERIRKKIEADIDSKEATLSCSIGIASWPTDGVMREEIVQAADTALYFSKQTGRNRIALASELNRSLETPNGNGVNGEEEVLNTIHALAATVDAKDSYTYGHSKKTSQYAVDLAEAIRYSEEDLATIKAAALLHDIGKIRISESVLGKRGLLDDADWETIHEHPKVGVAILKHVRSLSRCLAAIQHHHERWDGSGYPSGLKGDKIPLDARILAIADAYDAMTSSRPYREKLSHADAIRELERYSGTQFDPVLVQTFADMWKTSRAGSRGTTGKTGNFKPKRRGEFIQV